MTKTETIINKYCKVYNCNNCPLRLETIRDKISKDNVYKNEHCYMKAREDLTGWYNAYGDDDKYVKSLIWNLTEIGRLLNLK